MAVHAAVGHQADEMERRAVFQAVVHSAGKRLVFKKSRRLYGLCDAGQLLIDHAARADVRVSDFVVAHLAVRKADVHAGGADCGIGIGGKNAVEIRVDAARTALSFSPALTPNPSMIIRIKGFLIIKLP